MVGDPRQDLLRETAARRPRKVMNNGFLVTEAAGKLGVFICVDLSSLIESLGVLRRVVSKLL